MTASAVTSPATVAAITTTTSPVRNFINTRSSSRQPYFLPVSSSSEQQQEQSSSSSTGNGPAEALWPLSLKPSSTPPLVSSSPSLSFLVDGTTIRTTHHFATSSSSAVAKPFIIGDGNILSLTAKTNLTNGLSTTSIASSPAPANVTTADLSNATASVIVAKASVTSPNTTTISLHSSKTTPETILTSSKRPMIIIYPTVSPESIVIPIVSCIFGFPLLALLIICCLRRRAKLARERDRRRNYDMQDHAVSLVRFSPIHRLNNRSARAISLRPERSLSRGFPSLELDTVIEERSDAEQTQTDLLSPESPVDERPKYRDFNSS